MGLLSWFFTVFGGWYGSNRPMTAFQAVSSSIETVLNALLLKEIENYVNTYLIRIKIYS